VSVSRSAWSRKEDALFKLVNRVGEPGRTPPTPPALIWRRSANRSEHVPAENPGPDVLKTSRGKVFINAGASAIATEQVLLKRSCAEGPGMKRGAADAERVVDVLVRAGAEAVERDRETFYTKLGHGVSRGCGWLRKMACDA
jgi:hypothetical protein